MADWVTISSLATAGGTLVLAAATFSSVRSGNRSARIAERALQLGLRPVLVNSRYDDPAQKVDFGDRHRMKVTGGLAEIEDSGDVIYLAMSVRNVGAGLAVMRGWHISPRVDLASPQSREEERLHLRDNSHPPLEEFRVTQRDIYVAAGDVGFWQGALRDPADPARDEVHEAMRTQEPLTLHILYGDHEDGQLTITRFGILPRDGGEGWTSSVARHWYLERE